jgi:hypothetical protein
MLKQKTLKIGDFAKGRKPDWVQRFVEFESMLGVESKYPKH